MMLVWMTYAAFVGALVAGAAVAVDRIARIARLPLRAVWALAIVLAVALAVRTPPVAPVVSVTTIGAASQTLLPPVQATSWQDAIAATVRIAADWLDVSRIASAARASAIADVDDRVVAGGWVALSVACLLVFVGVHARLGRSKRRWPQASVDGQSVRIAPHVGPAAVGLVRSEVVLPRWLMARSNADQRMAIAHEAEHVRARDPQLLGGACVALIVFPWNPALWYLVSRLRLAIELDCDRRVLRRGATPEAYGTLLVAVAEFAAPLRPSALAFADDSSHLHTRIIAMDTRRRRFARTQAATAALAGGITLFAACEAKPPTAADIDRMNGASAESAAHKLGLLKPVDSVVTYTVNGVSVPAEQARAIPAASIDHMSIEKNGKGGTITIATKPSADLVRREPGGDTTLALAVESEAAKARGGLRASAKLSSDTAIVWFVDGVQVDYSTAVRFLDRDRIENVEVLKGPAAEAAYNVAAGKAVVAIKTKR